MLTMVTSSASMVMPEYSVGEILEDKTCNNRIIAAAVNGDVEDFQ